MRTLLHIALLVVIMNIALPSHSQNGYGNSELDSLFQIMSESYSTNEGLRNIDIFLNKARELDNQQAIRTAYGYKGGSYTNMRMYKRLDAFMDSIDTYTDLNVSAPSMYSYLIYARMMSDIYQGRYRLAIDIAKRLYKESHIVDEKVVVTEKNREEVIGAVQKRIAALRCLGIAHSRRKQVEKALSYLNECIELAKRFTSELNGELIDANGDRVQISLRSDWHDRTLGYLSQFENSIKRYVETHENGESDVILYEIILNYGYAETYVHLGNMKMASFYLKKAEQQLLDNSISSFMKTDYYRIMSLYHEAFGRKDFAYAYADSCARFCRDSGELEDEINALKTVWKMSSDVPASKYGREIGERIIALSDSLSDSRYQSSLEDISAVIDLDRYELATQKLSAQRKYWILSSIIVILASLVVVFIILRSRTKEKQRILAQQKVILEAEVERQTSEIILKNRDITSSLEYAKKIQQAILPDMKKFAGDAISGAYVYYRPCETVSGDFYWTYKVGDTYLFACADCTGHGVPGAFLSMIGSTSLNEICGYEHITNPTEILNRLDSQLIDVLNQSSESIIKDSIDISILTYNSVTGIVEIASARRPVYAFIDGVLTYVKGTRRSIGDREDINRRREFETTKMAVKKGDVFYLITDGFKDQFGGQTEYGPQGTLFTSIRVEEMLKHVSKMPMSAQLGAIDKTFETWKGTCSQVDDVSLVCVKI